jgi:hypothetical protein
LQTPWKQPLEKDSQTPPGFTRRAEELRSLIRALPASVLAELTHSDYIDGQAESGEFRLFFHDQEIIGSFPELKFCNIQGNELADFQQLLLLYYFSTADGSALTEKWVSFADLPGGRMYSQAFQGYSGDEIVKVFGVNLEYFKSACNLANGQVVTVADAAYNFQVLPMVSLRFVYWLGDEDFPSSCKVLFDSSVTHYLPVDACAILGSSITHRIIKYCPKN